MHAKCIETESNFACKNKSKRKNNIFLFGFSFLKILNLKTSNYQIDSFKIFEQFFLFFNKIKNYIFPMKFCEYEF